MIPMSPDNEMPQARNLATQEAGFGPEALHGTTTPSPAASRGDGPTLQQGWSATFARES